MKSILVYIYKINGEAFSSLSRLRYPIECKVRVYLKNKQEGKFCENVCDAAVKAYLKGRKATTI